MEPDWVTELVLPYEQVVATVEPLTGDSVVAAHWPRLKDLLSLHPEPKTIELANARWVEFLCGIWRLVEGYWRRQAHAAAARRY